MQTREEILKHDFTKVDESSISYFQITMTLIENTFSRSKGNETVQAPVSALLQAIIYSSSSI